MSKEKRKSRWLFFGKDKYTYDTIDELVNKSMGLAVGEVVTLNGYYSADDGATHKRVIADTDDGSGVQLRNRKWANIVHNGEVNVSWFGAKGDGVTDDSSFIKKSISFLTSKNGGTINFSAKKYVLNNSLYFKKSIILKGITKSRINFEYGTVLDFSNASGDYAINIGNDIGQGIENLKIIGTKNINKGIILSEGSFNNTIRNVDIKGFVNGIYCKTSWNNVFEKITVSYCENGFVFTGTTTSSSYISCLCYNSEVGFLIEKGMPYSSFLSCGTDHVTKGVVVKSNLSNTGFYNFGFEDYQVCWDINTADGIVNINGFSQYSPRYDAFIFAVRNIRRLNLFGCDLSSTSGANLFFIQDLGNEKLYGAIRSYGCKFNNSVGNHTKNLDRVIQDGNLPYMFLRKTSIKDNAVKYDGIIEESLTMRIDVPNNNDEVVVEVKCCGESINESCSIYVKNENGVIKISNSKLSNLSFKSWDNSAGEKGKAFSLVGDVKLIFFVTAIAYNTAKIPNISDLKVAYDF